MKHFNSIIYLICLFFVAISCTNKNSHISTSLHDIRLKNKITELKGQKLQEQSVIWSGYIESIFKNKIFAACYVCDSVYQIYDVENEKISKTGAFAAKGNGPGELIVPISSLDSHTKKLFLYDASSTYIKMFKIDITSFGNLYDKEKWEKINFPEHSNFLYEAFVPYDENSFVALGGDIFGDRLLTFIDPIKNEVLPLAIEYPKDNSNIPDRIKSRVYRHGNLLKRPSATQYLYYCKMGCYAEIISIENPKTNINRKILTEDFPIYKASEDNMNPTYDNQSYTGVKGYVTDKYIYLMPEPYKRKDYFTLPNYKGYPNSYSDKLYIFDWNGNFIELYQLDKPILSFVVDEDDSFLYASTTNSADDEIMIEKFSLYKHP